MGRGDDLEKLRRHQQVLVELSHVASQKLPSENLLTHTVAQVARAVEVDHVKILRYRPETGDLIAEAGTGWRPGVVGHATFGADLASPPGLAFQTGQPVVIPNIDEADDFRISPTCASTTSSRS